MKNRKGLFIILGISFTFILIVSGFLLKKDIKDNGISNGEIELINEKSDETLEFQESLNGILNTSSGSHEYSNIKSITKEINTKEIIDFYIDYDIASSLSESNVEFVFANNKMTFLVNSIFDDYENSFQKILFISYLKSYFNKKSIKISHFINQDIDYLKIYELDKNEYDKKNITKNIKRYFVLSNLISNNHLKDREFLDLIYSDLVSDFSDFSNSDKLHLLFYMTQNGEIEKFLTETDLDIENIFKINKLNDSETALYLYIFLKNNLIDGITDFSQYLEGYQNFDEKTLILVIASLNYLGLDYSSYYEKLDETSNLDMDLETQFFKFLVFKDLNNEYNSYDKYSKFWYSAGLLSNRYKEYDIIRKRPYLREVYSLEKLSYKNKIDARVASFRGDKFYLNVIIKQK